MNNVLGYGLPDVEFSSYDINCLMGTNNLVHVCNQGNLFGKAYYYGAESCIPCIVDKTNNHVVSVIKNGERYIIPGDTWNDLSDFEDWFKSL